MSDEQTQPSGVTGMPAVTLAALSAAHQAALNDDPAQTSAAANQADAANSEAGLIERRIAELQSEHLALDALIAKLTALPGVNDFELRRLKKRKLKVKDSIILLQLQLEPDTRA